MKILKLTIIALSFGFYSGISHALTVTPDNLTDILVIGDGPVNSFGREIEGYEESIEVEGNASSPEPYPVGFEDGTFDGDHDGNNVFDGSTYADWVAVTVTQGGLFSLVTNFWISSSFPPELGFLSMRIYDATAGVSTWSTDPLPLVASSTTGAPIELSLDAGDYLVQLYGNIDLDEPLPQSVNYSLEISTVIPLPAAVWLFGTAILGLIGFRRKQKSGAIAV